MNLFIALFWSYCGRDMLSNMHPQSNYHSAGHNTLSCPDHRHTCTHWEVKTYPSLAEVITQHTNIVFSWIKAIVCKSWFCQYNSVYVNDIQLLNTITPHSSARVEIMYSRQQGAILLYLKECLTLCTCIYISSHHNWYKPKIQSLYNSDLFWNHTW